MILRNTGWTKKRKMILRNTGWTKKTGPFLRADNFATADG